MTELSTVQKDALDDLASLGCNVVFVQYDEVFMDYQHFHLASMYPKLLDSPVTIHVQEDIDGQGYMSELLFKVEYEFKEHDSLRMVQIEQAITMICDLKPLISTLIYYGRTTK